MIGRKLDYLERLRGALFRRKRYSKLSDIKDHDHCAACWIKFTEFDGPGMQHEGYATCDDYEHGADYEWICVSCFSDLKASMGWVDVAENFD